MRKTIDVSIPHRLTRDEARSRLRQAAGLLQTQIAGTAAGQVAQVHEAWQDYHNDFRFTALGQSITGRMDVEADVIKLSVDVPWILAALADRIRGRIEQEARRLLDKK
jgi:hypothetical protein